MVVQLFCLTSGSGMPLFIRKKGDKEPISFAQIASVNGVYMFAKSHGIDIRHVTLEGGVVAWKDFNDSIMLIAMATGVTANVLHKFLDTVLSAVVLLVGSDDLKNVKNAERLKRELRVTYRLIDKLLDSLECVEKSVGSRNPPTNARGASGVDDFVETIMCQESATLSNCLDNWMDVMESAYGCLYIHGRLTVATQSWWELSCAEKRLLSLLSSVSTANCTAVDIPVFLPTKSPSVPFRLVCLRLVDGVDVAALCGPNPPLGEVEHSALQVWRPLVNTLRAAEKTYPRNFPTSMVLDSNILGVLLVHFNCGKFMISRNVGKKETCSLSGTHRLNVLRTFYNESASMLASDGESYWCSEYHKCHGLRQAHNLICVLYSAAVPSHTMRLLTKQCLKILTSDKNVPW